MTNSTTASIENIQGNDNDLWSEGMPLNDRLTLTSGSRRRQSKESTALGRMRSVGFMANILDLSVAEVTLK